MKDSFIGGDYLNGEPDGKGKPKKKGRWGLYIALIFCLAVIGVSGYYINKMYNRGVSTDTPISVTETPDEITPTPAPATPEPTKKPKASVAKSKAVKHKAKTAAGDAEKKPVAAVAGVERLPQYSIPVEGGKIITPYSGDNLVYNSTYGDWRTHKGIDISAQRGAQVKAVADGVIERVYTDDELGITIVINHGDVKSVYSGLSVDNMVKEGQNVKAGQIISGIGITPPGEGTLESHLHFEMQQDGKDVDPSKFVNMAG